MNVLLIDPDGCGTHMAYLAAHADHAVKWWQPKDEGRIARDGFGFPGVTRVEDWKAHMPWAKRGIVINLFNDPKIGKELDRYREFGYPIFGPTVKSAQLEIKRSAGMKFMQRHGLAVPEYETFESLEEALAYAKKSQDPGVFKTMGDEEDKSLSYVSSDPADMVGRIEDWIKSGMKLKGPCMIQEKIDGIEVGVSGWMGKVGFLEDKWNVNFEFKKLMTGDYGPNTGEMGTVCKYAETSKLATESLEVLEDDLVKLGHIGDLDVNFIISDKGVAHPLEFTCRYGWPSTQILMECCEGDDPIQWKKDALNGKDTLKVTQDVACGVLMCAPPFPYPDEEQKACGLVVSGIEDVWDKVAPWQIELTKGPVMKDGAVATGPVYKTTGPYVCVVVGKGHDVHDATAEAYEVGKHIKFANRIVRDDIGKRLEKELPKLKALGYDEMPDY